MIGPLATPPLADWTVLVYQDADSSLRPAILDNFQALAKSGGDEHVRVAAQIGPGLAQGCERYVLDGSAAPRPIETSSADMRSPQTLDAFLQWGMRALPARHTMLILAGHGQGWRGVCTSPKGIGGIPLDALRETLQRAPHAVDVLGFDACQMGQAEVLRSLPGTAPVVLGSEELIGPPGWPYAAILTDLKAHPERSPREVGKAIVGQAQADETARQQNCEAESVFTLAAYDMERVPELVRQADALAGAVLDAKVPPVVLRGVAHCAQGFNRGFVHPPDSDFRDLVGFALGLANDEGVDDERVLTAARALLKTAEQAIVAEQHAGQEERHAFGLSAYLPTEASPDAPPPLGPRWAEMLRYMAR